MSAISRAALCLLVGVFLSVFSASAQDQSREALPDLKALRARVEALYKAEKRGDLQAYYALMSAQQKAELTYDDLVEAMKKEEYQLVRWKVLEIKRLSEKESAGRIVARVAMDVRIRKPGERSEPVEDQTDYWVFEIGAWYWFWRGWPYD